MLVSRQAQSFAHYAALLAIFALALLAGGDDARAGAILFVVNSTGDQPDASLGDNYCDADADTPGPQCTIRAAFGDLDAGTEVHFNIPGCPPACTISPNGALPSLANNNLIDGTTQPGYNGTPLITIDGTNIGNGAGINLGNSSIAKIRGMVIRNVDDDHGIVGGAVTSFEISDSIISGNAGAGVALYPPLSPPPVTLRIDVTDSQFTGNVNGIVAGSSGGPFNYAEISGSTFSGNSNRGIELYLSGYLHFDGNLVSNNTVDGAYMVSSSQGPIITASLNDNIFEGNGASGVTTGATASVAFARNQSRNNAGDGANLSGEINEELVAEDNVLEGNDGAGLRTRATATASITGNTFASNGGDGANVLYEQYVGPGVPPPPALTFNDNDVTGNFGAGLLATDEFLNFSLGANRNTFGNNGQGLVTSAYSLSAADNIFTLNAAEGLVTLDPSASGLILRNTFTVNGTNAVSQNGDGVAVNFNRIAMNGTGVVNFGLGVSNAINNWWGCNEGPYGSNCNDQGQAVDPDPWLVLTPSANPTSILTGQTSIILGDFTINSDGTDTFDGGSGGQPSQGNHIPDGTMVEFESDLGNFGGEPQLLAPTSGGVAGVTLSADEGPGTAHVMLGLDAAQLVVEVIVSQGPTPTPSATPTQGPSPSPTASATATPTPSASPSPSATGTAVQRVWGNSDCSPDGIRSRDAQAIGKFVLQGTPLTQTEQCPDVGTTVTVNGTPRIWGNWDCSLDGIRSRDGQATGKFVLQSAALSQTLPCPAVGSQVTVLG